MTVLGACAEFIWRTYGKRQAENAKVPLVIIMWQEHNGELRNGIISDSNDSAWNLILHKPSDTTLQKTVYYCLTPHTSSIAPQLTEILNDLLKNYISCNFEQGNPCRLRDSSLKTIFSTASGPRIVAYDCSASSKFSNGKREVARHGT